MHFFSQIAAFAVAAATMARANSITFINQDDTTRRVVFTPSAGHEAVESIDVPGNDQAKVEFPASWIGNAYSVSEGAADTPGMLAEVTFQGWNDLTYFDVSAIVNAADHDGVKQLYPASQLSANVKTTLSGCLVFPCSTAYYHPDDIQTVSTQETDLICTLGSAADLSSREVGPELFPRNYVLGKL
ncbi:DNase1 protein [Xylariaceae sp. FL0662B]|nr:DNase1 protein [Xylariaceae sp. FL0662B]